MRLADKKIVILGVGNLLFSDEGVGVHAAQALDKLSLPSNVTVHDGNTLGLLSLPLFSGADTLILIDAVEADGKPGEVKIYNKDEIMLDSFPVKVSPHQIGIQEALLMSELKGECPEEVVFFGVIPESYAASVELTETGKRALNEVIRRVLEFLDS